MESNKGCSNIESKKSSDIFFNQRFIQQSSLLGIYSVKNIAPKEWLNNSNEIDHPFQKQSMRAKNDVIEWVLDYCNHEYKINKLIKTCIEKDLISDNDSNKSVYSDANDPCYLPTEKELFKVLNKSLGTTTTWDSALQRSWFNWDNKDEEYSVFCPCGRSHKECLEQEGFGKLVQKDIVIGRCKS